MLKYFRVIFDFAAWASSELTVAANDTTSQPRTDPPKQALASSQPFSHSVTQSVSRSVVQSVSEVDLQVASVLSRALLVAAVVVWQPMLSSCLSISLVVAWIHVPPGPL